MVGDFHLVGFHHKVANREHQLGRKQDAIALALGAERGVAARGWRRHRSQFDDPGERLFDHVGAHPVGEFLAR